MANIKNAFLMAAKLRIAASHSRVFITVFLTNSDKNSIIDRIQEFKLPLETASPFSLKELKNVCRYL
jgi:hypothetical protein